MPLYESIPRRIIETPDHLKTQEMCERALDVHPWTLKFFPDHLKTKKMCDRAIEENPYTLEFVPDHLKMKEMCERAVDAHPWTLKFSRIILRQKRCVMLQWPAIHIYRYLSPTGLWHKSNWNYGMMTIIIVMLKNLLSSMKAIKYDIYINEEETYEMVIPSQQPKAKNFRKHCCNVMFP